MFKYNELSDLLNGSLVTPLSKTDDGLIRCIDNEGNECFYEFDDFDFDKLPEDRITDEPIIDPNPEPEPKPNPEPEEVEKDDSEYDGTDKDVVIEDDENNEEKIIEDERFLTSAEAKNILKVFGFTGPAMIWRDII